MEAKECKDYWNGATVTKLWDGILGDLGPHLVAVTQLATGRGATYHKSKTGSLSCRTCNEKLRKRGVYKELNI